MSVTELQSYREDFKGIIFVFKPIGDHYISTVSLLLKDG